MGEKQKVIIKKGAPEWMVSFSDLNTLLLTFFILLLVFAKEKAAGMQDTGSGQASSDQKKNIGGPYNGDLRTIIGQHVINHYKKEDSTEDQAPNSYATVAKYLPEDFKGKPTKLPDSSQQSITGAFLAKQGTLTSDARRDLARFVGKLGGEYSLLIKCRSQKGERGTDDATAKLALARALNVADHLVVNHGIEEGWVSVQGKVVQTDTGSKVSERALSISIQVIQR